MPRRKITDIEEKSPISRRLKGSSIEPSFATLA